MKKLILIAFSALALTACDAGSRFDSNTITDSGDKVWRLEAAGSDLRVYEFTSKAAPHMQCVFVAGDSKGGMACFPKQEE